MMAKEKQSISMLVPKSEQPYELPENWIWTMFSTLVKDIADGPFGSNLKQEHYTSNKEVRIIQLSNIGENGWREENIKYTTFEHVKTISRSIVNFGEIVMAKMMPAGRAIIVPGHEKMFILSSDAVKIVPRNFIDTKFFLLGINSQFFRNQIQENTQGITRARTSIGKLKQYAFPLPPLPEQRRIIERIESLFAKLDRAKELAQSALDSFETRKAAILHKAFTGELIGLNGVKLAPLTELTQDIRIGPFGTMLHAEEYITGGVPVINPKHIINQIIIPQEKITISQQKANELNSYVLKANDIILGRRGEMGRTAPISKKEEGWICGTGSMIVRLKNNFLAPFYSNILSSQATVEYLEKNAVGSTMKNLNEKIVKNIPVPMFSLPEQQEIVRILDTLFDSEKQAKELCDVIEKIDLMKKAILARAFRGELGTNNPAEENATGLFWRV